MTGLDALQSVQFVTADGKRFAVLSAEDWEAMIEWLETVDIAAVLLGSGVRLFDHLAAAPVFLGSPTVFAGVGVTHLRYPVRRA